MAKVLCSLTVLIIAFSILQGKPDEYFPSFGVTIILFLNRIKEVAHEHVKYVINVEDFVHCVTVFLMPCVQR